MKHAPILLIPLFGLASATTASPPTQKLPWIQPEREHTGCGASTDAEQACGTRHYCTAHKLYNGPKDYRNAEECFDAHQSPPLLPWVQAPDRVRAKWCPRGLISRDCPRVCRIKGPYMEELECGTLLWCAFFDDHQWWPFEFKDSKDCLDAHEAPPPPVAVASTPVEHSSRNPTAVV
ncbi:hypothetical protein XA68_13413 [Ophiocordyceps unilateralis]|uniref:Uncharacterized protein n=1 Tax=Ophiocordyceps unilateralis TaxID=268505 RepID=A0A2A9PBR2_OPHUN|nr:hypothetical protein XA68_13413 [Ophiocordyceps unilateralis]